VSRRKSSDAHTLAIVGFYSDLEEATLRRRRALDNLGRDDRKFLVQILHMALQTMTKPMKSTANQPLWKVSTAMMDDFVQQISDDCQAKPSMEPVDALVSLPYSKKGYSLSLPDSQLSCKFE
jgi:hypothetical protein